ncbi:DUF2891 family protein [Elizabethkingia argentiflava]|uniref:DUF2891 family protein n=1 Tax=Elizabethkingia argenteiflava TaxID=2681556 RepID=A0A845PVA4_9FLAO|nr:DUF2891 domain-containing protein [Elizabethkingia argenteiflava]NAW51585.1 DUF2891 family protein [Elizabethkingia argenteiflava]
MKYYPFLIGLGLVSTQILYAQATESASLNGQMAKKIFALPTHCIQQEYPNKLGQVIGEAADLKTPRQLRPIFYGCFDWHSSVHGFWSIVVLLKKYPHLDQTGQVRKILNQMITPENVEREVAFFKDKKNDTFERTYGWSWLLKLQEALYGWADRDAERWHITLKPLEAQIIEGYKSYLPKLLYPIRTGQHDNTAFSLSLTLEYARRVQDKDFESLIIATSKRLFLNDINCNMAYEPGGNDFLSPCLEEALLMSKILPASEYRTWLNHFMPQLFYRNFKLSPGRVSDSSDGKLVHLHGLNFSRAVCLNSIANVLPELEYLRKIGKQHFEHSFSSVFNSDYMGSHWLGTFALYAILE